MIARRMAEDAINNISKWDVESELEWEGVTLADRDALANEVTNHLDNATVWMGN